MLDEDKPLTIEEEAETMAELLRPYPHLTSIRCKRVLLTLSCLRYQLQVAEEHEDRYHADAALARKERDEAEERAQQAERLIHGDKRPGAGIELSTGLNEQVDNLKGWVKKHYETLTAERTAHAGRCRCPARDR